jgi:GGDEF domain-containing protein
VDSSRDGILVFDDHRKKVTQNKRLVEMFHMPSDVADAEDEERRINFPMASIKNPQEFCKKLMHLHNHQDDAIHSEFQLSTTDRLTGISNRRRFDEFLQREWRRSIRQC